MRNGLAHGVESTGHGESTPAPLPSMLVVEEMPLTSEDCAIGEVLCGRYRVEGVIGRGSMGIVVAATHLGFDELVAIKFIRPEMRKIEGIVSRFAREAKASVRIRNAHAVNVLDVDVTHPIGPFFAMEYLWGSNLEELLDARGPLGVATATHYVLQACEALAAAHAQGIIHRDIKPQNMFLARQGTLESIKVLDFGISKAPFSGQIFGDDLSTHEQDWVMGTPLYMSPEQLRHAPDLDERTDIWSLGTVLYELLTGQPPFAGDTQSQVARQVFGPFPEAVSAELEGVPSELCQVIRRCLAQDRAQRFGNVAELAQALAPFAPLSARLHVERAMALLGLEVTEVTDDDIEDLELWPLEAQAVESARQEPALSSTGAKLGAPNARRRRPYFEALALLLACAMVWLGARYVDLRLHDQAAPSAALPELSTEQHALRACPNCPSQAVKAAPVVAAPPSLEPPELSSPLVSTPPLVAPPPSPPLVAPPFAAPALARPPLAASRLAASPPSNPPSVAPPPVSRLQATQPAPGRTAWGARARSASPASPSAVPATRSAAASSAATPPTPPVRHAAEGRRATARKAELAETRPTFRLIAERPRTKFALLPVTSSAAASLPQVKSE